MVLTNRKMFLTWLGLVGVLLILFVFGRPAGGHPLTGWHDSLRAFASGVHYVLAPVAGNAREPAAGPDHGRVVLTVQASPANARVRVMNIAPAYRPGMELEPGSYDIEVSAPGYQSQRRWVSISGRAANPEFRLSRQ